MCFQVLYCTATNYHLVRQVLYYSEGMFEKPGTQSKDLPTAIGDIMANAPGFIISLKEADATIDTHRL